MAAGPAGRWSRGGALHLAAPVAAFASVSAEGVLAGGNAALLETEAGWELVQFQTAELTGPGTWRLTGLLRGQGGSVSGAAVEGARFVLLDGAVQRAELLPLERGRELIWKAGGAETAQTLAHEDRESLPWQPCHLRLRDGEASWVRRGLEVADSWTFPNAPNAGRFAAEFDLGSGFGGRIETDAASCPVPPGAVGVRVAEIGANGRTGPWLSIGAGSP